MMKSTVIHVGSEAYTFEQEKIIILFGPKAPQELRDISIIHDFELNPEEPIKDNHLVIDGKKYDIVVIGKEVLKNLATLGHVSVYFMDPPTDILPGSIYVKPFEIPQIKHGSVIEIL
jgi:glucitol/sorbitol PTS system EIIA component